ncbi:MAG: hypothetical protein II404_03605 [Prevotella sp.]|nr:hypothetical protein [Prevotella sp.]
MAAANSIFKLKVETSEYDQKLANAAKGIRHLADVAHKGDGDLTGLEKSTLDYIKALGEMDTKSRTAAGSVRELESTYKELKVIYDQLNEVEKADEGGKALAASLEQIKQRAQEAKAQLESASQSLSDNGQQAQQSSGLLDALASKFTLNIDALKLFDMGLSAVNMALDVAKDAFMSSEANVDEWGRVIDSSKSLYEGFLIALNTGDISGYLGRIDEIVQAARTAYNELDRLGTMKTIQAPKMSAQQTENERMRMMIQTGRYIAPVDGRKASMQNGQLLTPDQIKRIEQQLQGGMQKVVTLVGNEVAQTGRAIDAVYNRQAQELGMSLKEFRKGTSSMAEFDKRMAGYDQYQKWREQHTTIDLQSGRETVARGNPFEQFAKWGTFRVDGQRYNDLVKLIQQRDQQAAQAYSMQSQAYRTMNRAEGVTLLQIMGGGTGGGGRSGKGGSSKGFDISSIAFDANKAGLAAAMSDEEPSEIWKAITEGAKESKNSVEELTAALEALNEAEGVTVKDTKKDSKELGKNWKDAGSAILAVGSAMSQIEDPAAKVIGTIAQAVATVALTFASSLKGTVTPWDWIAAAAAGTATMISTISAIHSATGYASGGVIKGNSYSGDNIMGMVDGGAGGFVGLNAGEIVLNRSQQGNLASQLQGSGFGNARLVGRLKGRDILLSIDRELSATGKGQLATWK